MSLRERLVTIADRTQRAQLWLAAAALVVLMAVTVVDVFMRYLFNSPVRGSFDAVESLLLVFVFNSMAAAFFGRRNVVIDLIDSFVHRMAAHALIRVADVLSVMILGLLMWAMLVPASQSFAYADIKQEMGIPIYALWIVALASMAATIFCAAVLLLVKPASGHTEPL